MPLLTVVTFTDADGDEFPIAIQGWYEDDEAMAHEEARAHLDELISSGRFRPTMPVKVTGIKHPEGF